MRASERGEDEREAEARMKTEKAAATTGEVERPRLGPGKPIAVEIDE